MIVFVTGIGAEATVSANDRISLGVLQRYFFALIESLERSNRPNSDDDCIGAIRPLVHADTASSTQIHQLGGSLCSGGEYAIDLNQVWLYEKALA